jgi:hypothetical protein
MSRTTVKKPPSIEEAVAKKMREQGWELRDPVELVAEFDRRVRSVRIALKDRPRG